MTNFTLATVSNQVQSNHIAWSMSVSHHETLDAAQEAARKLWAEMCEIADQGDGNGYIGETIIIHDGESCY